VDLATGRVTGRVLDAPGMCDAMAFSPDKQVLAALCSNQLSFWNIATGRALGPPISDPGTVRSLAFSPDGKYLAVPGLGNQVQLWDVATRRAAEAPFSTNLTAPIEAVSFAPDGHTLATGGDDGVARLWRVTMTAPPWARAPHAVYALAYSVDGKTLAAGTASGTVYRLSLASGRQNGAPVTDPAGPVNAVAFGGSAFVIDAGQGTTDVRRWDLRTDRQAGPPLIKDNIYLPTAGISEDGRFFAYYGINGQAQVVNASTGKSVGPPLDTGLMLVSSLAFSHDDRELVVEGEKNNVEYVRVWNVVTHRPVGPEIAIGSGIANTGPGLAVTLSPDGHTLAVTDAGGNVQLWDLVSSQRIGAAANLGSGTALEFSPDDGTLAIGGADGAIRLLDVRFLTAPAASLCMAAARALSTREWTEYAENVPYQRICS
jgi:dipeptidyl aminopeptidase/acylaminoacyl peptidase